MSWSFTAGRPIYIQIAEHLINDILSGKYEKGERLPSVRDLALEASVNPNTMQRALTELEGRGLVVTHRNAGRTVTEEEVVLESTRKQLAKQIVNEFRMKMAKLGYSEKEAEQIMQEEGGCHNG